MGNSVSSATESDLEDVTGTLASVVTILESKVETIENNIKASRLNKTSTSELTGGRTLMHVSEIRVSSGAEPDEQIGMAIKDFFDVVQAPANGNDTWKTKAAALDGAQRLLTAGLSALFGVKNGQSMHKKSFVVLYINNSFVRVDFEVYTYNASASRWGYTQNESGACYVADLAVLDIADIKPSEIDFLLSQTLDTRWNEFDALMEIKVRFTQMSILSRMISDKSLTFSDLAQALRELQECQVAIGKVFYGNFKDAGQTMRPSINESGAFMETVAGDMDGGLSLEALSDPTQPTRRMNLRSAKPSMLFSNATAGSPKKIKFTFRPNEDGDDSGDRPKPVPLGKSNGLKAPHTVNNPHSGPALYKGYSSDTTPRSDVH